jgi:aminoglycoside 3-N-acetyltransferase I
VIRRLQVGDEAILEALEEAYEKPIPHGPAVLADERSHVLAAFDGDKPVGYVLLYVLPRIDGRTMVFVYDVGVVGSHRRQGYGLELMSAAKQVMCETGAYKMFVLTNEKNEAAMALYAAAGAEREPDQAIWSWSLPG